MSGPSELSIHLETGATTTALVYRAKSADTALVLAHGAGANQRSDFIVDFATALAGLGLDVVTFNFLYTEQRRRIPDHGPSLRMCYRAVVEHVRHEVAFARRFLFIGGKSMGGRIATEIAASDADLPVAGIVLLGYPLHPPQRLDRRRDSHLASIGRPMLFLQGSRDSFGTPPELDAALARVMPTPTVHVVTGGDHSFKLPRRDAAAQTAVYDDVQRTIVEWITRVRGDAARSGTR